MLTVPQAARRVGRSPETIRRWIRAGKLASKKVGTQHLVEEEELDSFVDGDTLALPPDWEVMFDGRPMPNWEHIIRQDRASH